jgi:elongation factor Ts
MVTAAQVMELRKKTGAGMMECKKVLAETDGDEARAIELLQERGVMKAAKKADRIAAEGLVATYISDDKKIGAIVEVNSETDFVGKNEEFRAFVADVVKQVALNNPADVEALLAEKSIADDTKTVSEVLTSKIAKIGENLSIRRFERFETEGTLVSYIHGEGKIGVLADFDGADEELGKDICMQVAAVRPEYVNEEDVPADRVEKEKEILKAQVINEGRPENVAEKIVAGRLGKFYEQICLVDQAFVKDPNQKVKDLLKSKNASVKRFARFEKGEGLEKREENFAEEVAKQLNN